MKLIKTITALIAISLFGASYANAGSHAYTGPDLSGEKLTIFGPWLAPQDDDFRDVISIFEAATGSNKTPAYGALSFKEIEVTFPSSSSASACTGNSTIKTARKDAKYFLNIFYLLVLRYSALRILATSSASLSGLFLFSSMVAASSFCFLELRLIFDVVTV